MAFPPDGRRFAPCTCVAFALVARMNTQYHDAIGITASNLLMQSWARIPNRFLVPTPINTFFQPDRRRHNSSQGG